MSIEDRILPIQIRKDLIIMIQDIPFDLTETEGKKISRVIMAMVKKNKETIDHYKYLETR